MEQYTRMYIINKLLINIDIVYGIDSGPHKADILSIIHYSWLELVTTD